MSCWWQCSISVVVSLYLSLGHQPIIIISNWLLLCSLSPLSTARTMLDREAHSYLVYLVVRITLQLLLPPNSLNPQLSPELSGPYPDCSVEN